MEKIATAFLKYGKVYIRAFAQAKGGLWVGHGPVFVCDLNEEGVLANNIRSSLEYSVRGISHSGFLELEEDQRPLLEAMGARDWDDLATGAKAVSIQVQDGIITLVPTPNYWDESGTDLEDQAISAPLYTPDLGRLIVRAFALSG